MARKVYISSDMSVDEEVSEIAEKDPLAALIWPWILTAFDDWGRAEASPKRLKNKVFPANDLVTVEVIQSALQLYDKNLITLYEVDGKWYMSIKPETWYKWQTHIRREKREKDSSKIPAPDANSAQVRANTRDNAELRANLTNCIPSPSPSPSPSISTTTIEANPYKTYESEGFGTISSYTKEEIDKMCDEYGDRWVCEAMKRAVIRGKRNLGYVRGILVNWKADGIDEPWREEAQNEQPRGRNKTVTPFRNHRKGEILFSDDELDELNELSRIQLSQV